MHITIGRQRHRNKTSMYVDVKLKVEQTPNIIAVFNPSDLLRLTGG